MSQFSTDYYTEELMEEQERLDAVNDALDALDIDRFYRAVRRVGDGFVSGCAARVTDNRDVQDAQDALEALWGALVERIECLRPLAQEEDRREREWMEKEYRESQ